MLESIKIWKSKQTLTHRYLPTYKKTRFILIINLKLHVQGAVEDCVSLVLLFLPVLLHLESIFHKKQNKQTRNKTKLLQKNKMTLMTCHDMARGHVSRDRVT